MKNKHIQKLDEAIKLHQIHMDKPSTATESSQKKLMNLIKSAKMDMTKDMKVHKSKVRSAAYKVLGSKY